MVKGVLFDMDGTMLDTEPASEQCWKQSALECGFTIDDDFMHSLYGKNIPTITKMIKEHFEIDEDAEKIVEGRQRYYHKFLQEGEILKKPGLIEVLEYLKKKQIPAAVCTSTEREKAEIALRRSGIYEYFTGFVYGDMVTRTKPDPQGFHMAAEQLGVRPEECLVVEDSTNGVLAGKAAGGYTIYIPDVVILSEEVKEGITAEMKSLDEIVEWIEEVNIYV